MTDNVHRRVRRASMLALVAALVLGPAADAGDPPPPQVPVDKSTPWNTSTAPAAPRPPPADSTMSLRLYEDVDRQSPLPYRPDRHRRNGEAWDGESWAVDVSAVMTRCQDGSLLITALVIGGQLTPLDQRCPDEPRPGSSAPRCDAKRWNCSTPASP